MVLSGRPKFLVALVAVATLAGACGSSSKPVGAGTTTTTTTGGSTSGGTSPGGSGKTITIGLLNDVTGEAASGNKTANLGAEAGAIVAARDGLKFKFVVADTQTSPTAALTAAQTLVEQDHVSAVIAVSSLTFAAAPFFQKEGIPVVGVAEDNTEWTSDLNMFSVFGYLNSADVSTTAGQFMKAEGVTNVGAVGYGISPSSADSAKGIATSARAAGIKVGYLNANLPFGSTNVAPIALAMKSGGVDAFYASVDPNTSFSLITSLRQDGVNLKVALLPDGYGGDLSQAGPGAIQSAQGVYFSLSFEPVEMNTPATQQFVSALKQVGVSGLPTYAEYSTYTSVAALDAAYKAVGAGASHSQLVAALTNVQNFSAWGLLGSHTFDLNDRAGTATGIDACSYVTKLSGSTFQLVPNADPICGTPLSS